MMSAAAMENEPLNETLSFKDKRKFFEQEIKDQSASSPKPKDKRFTYLQEHEVAKLKTENERKLSLSSQEDMLKTMLSDQGHNAEYQALMEKSIAPTEPPLKTRPTKPERQHSAEKRHSLELMAPIVIGKRAERTLSAAEQRAIEAEKRTEWRKARLKSLEEDAMRAQAKVARVGLLDSSHSTPRSPQPSAHSNYNSLPRQLPSHSNGGRQLPSTHSDRQSVNGQLPATHSNGDHIQRQQSLPPMTSPHGSNDSLPRPRQPPPPPPAPAPSFQPLPIDINENQRKEESPLGSPMGCGGEVEMLIKSIICLTEEAEKEDPELDLLINTKLKPDIESAKLKSEESAKLNKEVHKDNAEERDNGNSESINDDNMEGSISVDGDKEKE